MPASKSSPKTKTYVLLKQPTLLKNKSLGKQGKEVRTSRSPSVWVANYAMAMYSKKYKQIGSVFLYRKGTVYRYNVAFKTKSGRKCATAKLTSRSVCKVTPGKVGKSRSCHPYGSGKSGKSGSLSHKSLTAKKKSLSKSKSELKKAKKSVSSAKKRVTKAKKAFCKTKSGSKKRSSAKKKVTKASKALSSAKKSASKLKSAVKTKTSALARAHKSLHKSC